MRIVTDDNDEKRRGLNLLADKYSPRESNANRNDEINKLINALAVLVLDAEHISGKEGKELAQARHQQTEK